MRARATFKMADVTDITPPLDTLDSQLDKLEDVLKPLLTDLNEVTSKLPLLDKAKLYVLATYTIEATLFCTNLSLLFWSSSKH